MRYKDFIISPFLFITLCCQITGEDYAPIGTGRPGMANPTTSVSVGLYQFEMGINSEMNDNFAYPLFFRTGIFSNAEFQIGYAENVSIGILYGGINLVDVLEQSIIIAASLSENNDDLSSTDIFLPFSISSSFPIWGQVAGSFPNQEGEDPTYSYALATGGGFGEKMSWFIEFFDEDMTTAKQGVDAGTTYLINNTMQVDFSGGVSLSDTESKFVEVGFSFRLPK